MSSNTLLQLDLPGVPKVRSGKVREMFDLGDSLLMLASDRISAYDVVLPNGIPQKGEVLTMFSHFWFDRVADLVPNHLLAKADDPLPEAVSDYAEQIGRRAMVVKKAQPLAIECVVRGYLAGSGWKEYQKQKTVCGIELPDGLDNSSKLPEPIFTPATKAEEGHDENISFEEAVNIVGSDIAEKARELSIELYKRGRDHAATKGIIIADTKFEFGQDDAGEITLIDEVMTPDSSRFWPAAEWQPGGEQNSFDKQYVRNYTETLVARGEWNKEYPGPSLPEEVIANTIARYEEALRRLTD